MKLSDSKTSDKWSADPVEIGSQFGGLLRQALLLVVHVGQKTAPLCLHRLQLLLQLLLEPRPSRLPLALHSRLLLRRQLLAQLIDLGPPKENLK